MISARLILCGQKLLSYEKAIYFAPEACFCEVLGMVRWGRGCALWERGGGKKGREQGHQARSKN